jgi:hypothetical protein
VILVFGQDDPACVAARAEGKKVVTELWVEASLDRGMLADADRVGLSANCLRIFCSYFRISHKFV